MGWRKIRYCPVKARHVARYVKRLVVSAAFCFTYDASAAELSRYSDAQTLAQANAEPNRGTATEIQNVQRLLKLLADRYPGKYASVDPGRVDGVYRAETQDAIRNFERISGSSTTRNNDRLVANILATLAQMSATQPADTVTEKSGAGDSPTAAATRPTEPKVEAPKIETPKAEAPADAGDAGKPVSTDAAPAAPAKAPDATPSAPKTPAPNRNRNVYFVQAASLKSLDAAKREWRRIFEENRAALKGEQVYFEQAAVGDRGTFFRILIGPIEEREAARTLCSFLKQNDQKCVVTMRNLAELSKSATSAGAPASPARAGAKPQSDIVSKPADIPADPAAPENPAPVTAPTAPSTGADTDGAPAAPSDQPKADATAPAEAPAAMQLPATAPAAPMPPPPAASPDPQQPGRPENPGSDATVADRSGNNDTAVAAAAPGEAPKLPAASAPPRSEDAAVKAETALLPTDPAVRPAEINAGAGSAPSAAAQAPVPDPSAGALAVARLIDHVRGYGKPAGIAAAAILIAGIAVYGWRRRNRQSMLAQIFRPANYSFAPVPASGAGPLGDLETDFESEPLRQSRVVRDEFLLGILGPESEEQGSVRPEDSAMRINSSLKTLLVQEPARYKSIFLNWIFLSKVGAALNKKEITIEQLSDRINREFDLLQTYFKIHLLELDDRHHIRMELPGLFYCLQLSQMKKRQHSAAFSAA